MKKINLLFYALCIINFSNAAEIVAKTGTHQWNQTSSWNLNRLPQCGDIIVIPSESKIIVNDQIKIDQCNQKADFVIYGELQFESGKKVSLSGYSTVYVFNQGKILPSTNGGGNSELIELGKSIFWKAGDGILNGTNLTVKESKQDLVNEQLNKNTQLFTLNKANLGGTFTSKKGVKIVIAANSLKNNQGQLITGEAQLKFVEIFDRTSMIITNKTTTTSSGKLLQSGGEFYLSISSEGKEIPSSVNGVNLIVPANTDPKMELFNGQIDLKTQILSWNESKEVMKINSNSNTNGEYIVPITSWGWSNIDKYREDPRPKTKVRVSLPSIYNFENTSVVIAIKGEKATVCPLDQFNEGYFEEHFGMMPIGTECYIVALSSANNLTMYSIQAITITEGTIYNIPHLLPTSSSDLLTLLNAIP